LKSSLQKWLEQPETEEEAPKEIEIEETLYEGGVGGMQNSSIPLDVMEEIYKQINNMELEGLQSLESAEEEPVPPNLLENSLKSSLSKWLEEPKEEEFYPVSEGK